MAEPSERETVDQASVTTLAPRGAGWAPGQTKETASAAWELRAFGSLTAMQAGRVLPLGPLRHRALLGLLLVRSGSVVAAGQLIDELWGARPPRHPLATLQTYVSHLRRALARAREQGGGHARLNHRAPGYVLELDPELVDVHRFERLLERGRRSVADRRFDLARADLTHALSLWRAQPYLELVSYGPITDEIERLGHLRLTALEAQADACLALGDADHLVRVLYPEVQHNPTHERLVGHLMTGLYHLGRQAEALRLYEQTRRHLAEELGVDPGGELQRVHTNILHQRLILPEPPARPVSTTAGGAGAYRRGPAEPNTGPGRPPAATAFAATGGSVGPGRPSAADTVATVHSFDAGSVTFAGGNADGATGFGSTGNLADAPPAGAGAVGATDVIAVMGAKAVPGGPVPNAPAGPAEAAAHPVPAGPAPAAALPLPLAPRTSVAGFRTASHGVPTAADPAPHAAAPAPLGLPAPTASAPSTSAPGVARAAGGKFVGRERERALLGAHIQDALNGSSHLYAVLGEMGVGKTELVEDATAHLKGSPHEVVWGCCSSGEGIPEYWVWSQIFRQLAVSRPEAFRRAEARFGSLLAPLMLDPEAGRRCLTAEEPPILARFRIQDAMSETLLVLAAEAPLVVVLEDLDQADARSLELLGLLRTRLHGEPLGVVVIAEDTGVAADFMKGGVVTDIISDPRTRSLRLTGLSRAETADLVSLQTGVRVPDDVLRVLHGRSRGNPYFLHEFLAGVGDPELLHHRTAVESALVDVPLGVRQALGRRIAGLPEPVLEVLRCCSALGADFDLELVRHAVSPGTDPESAIEAAARCGLLRRVPRPPFRLTFRDALIQEVLLAELSGTERTRLRKSG
ncbi:AAA family ATPase [Streptomyces sp. NBC_00669]|uniref:BTAD domain-containing putative transcriptional regulator n=1 Tax=Streptomyces sp. NBC_00669 TaxID=2976011 RepID=UPI002E32C9FA|nr:BTAD domain-containing putative transcriptional regulator [Streptomyces sp. NBC_00669]